MKKNLFLSFCAMLMTILSIQAQTKIIAHRGAFKTQNLPENSIASLKEASRLGLYGSEFDVHLTKDNILVVNHNNDFYGLDIATSTYQELLAKKHPNGESIPTLEAYLKEGKKLKNIRLILELKTNNLGLERTLEATTAAVKMVHDLRVAKITDYIAFSFEACEKIHQLDPKANIQYLNGDKTPAEVLKAGINGIDYYYKVFQQHPEWIQEAKKAGMKTNVWTVNKKEDMLYFIEQGVSFITTNEPELLKSILEKH